MAPAIRQWFWYFLKIYLLKTSIPNTKKRHCNCSSTITRKNSLQLNPILVCQREDHTSINIHKHTVGRGRSLTCAVLAFCATAAQVEVSSIFSHSVSVLQTSDNRVSRTETNRTESPVWPGQPLSLPYKLWSWTVSNLNGVPPKCIAGVFWGRGCRVANDQNKRVIQQQLEAKL